MSGDRVCQFYLRGRCHRENCEFKHSTPDTSSTADNIPSSKPVCRFFEATGRCRFGDSCRFRHDGTSMGLPITLKKPAADSDDEDSSLFKKGDDSDEESVASGFTEFPIVAKKSLPSSESKMIKPTARPKDKQDIAKEEVSTSRKVPLEEVGDKTGSKEIEDSNVEGPLSELNVKSLEEQVQPPVHDSIDPDESSNAQDPKDAIEPDSGDKSPEKPSTPEVETRKSPRVIVASKSASEGQKDSGTKNVSPSGGLKTSKKTVADLSKEWDDDEDEDNVSTEKKSQDENEASSPKAPEEREGSIETIETIENFIKVDNVSAPNSNTTDCEQSATVDNQENSKEDWVTLVFDENGKAKETKSVYDLNPEGDDFNNSDEQRPSSPSTYGGKKRGGARDRGGMKMTREAKKEGVTKIGNNTYFYTGNKDKDAPNEDGDNGAEDEPVGESSEWDQMPEEYEDDPDKEKTPPGSKKPRKTKKHKTHSTAYVYAARSTAAKTRRCGECENCNKEDCNKCDACKDKPKNGGKGLKKQACIHRVCLWKNPSGIGANTPKGGSRGRPKADRKQQSASSPEVTKEVYKQSKRIAAQSSSPENQEEEEEDTTDNEKGRGRKGRLSLPVIAPGTTGEKKPNPDDLALPKFDPESFKPGYNPSIVKKGDSEYVVVVTGVKDTGLCGKYWSDIENLPSRRRSRLNDEQQSGNESSSTPTSIKSKSPSPTITKKRKFRVIYTSSKRTSSVTDPKEDKSKEQESASTVSSNKRKHSGKSTKSTKKIEQEERSEVSQPLAKKSKLEETAPMPESSERVMEMEVDNDKDEAPAAIVQNNSEKKRFSPTEPLSRSRGRTLSKTNSENILPLTSTSGSTTSNDNLGQATSSPTNLAAKNTVHNRSVSCVADTSTQREVVVECFAPYDDHRWVNIGKERDNMAPDAVQYARALRPPYHLLSFLRIKGHSTKGMSCTDKNTMVFVVLEGEITVVLHTTQFNAKKGDSFYIPPKNYYNLINQKAREAELSLIQFQYDGPLPTIAASSQSGNNRSSMRTATSN